MYRKVDSYPESTILVCNSRMEDSTNGMTTVSVIEKQRNVAAEGLQRQASAGPDSFARET